MLNKTKCATCGQTFDEWMCGMSGTQPAGSRIFGRDNANLKHCDVCCGQMDEKRMLESGKTWLYLSKDSAGWKLTNWPGTLSIRLLNSPQRGRHNIAGSRYDVWFRFKGFNWHGTQYGENTQICHVRRVR